MGRWMLLALVGGLLITSPLFAVMPLSTHDLGLGIVLGEPSGVNAQFFMTNRSTLDITAAWSFRHDGNLLVAADYQWYNNIADAPEEWSWYYGVGGYVGFPEHDEGILGVRIPLGIVYSIPRSIADVWLEVDPALKLIPETDGDFMGGIGITFWLR
jgi:hypothetical protein